MNTRHLTIFATTLALAASSGLSATGTDTSKPAAQVAFHEAERFTDFRMSEFYNDSDAAVLQKEFTQAIERSARHVLPQGYTLNIRFTDIDLAGDVNPFHRPDLHDVRVYRGVYMPRLCFDYALVDPEGQVVASGSERLIDMAYDMRVRLPRIDYTQIETDLLRDFISDLGRKIAKGQV